MVNSLSLILENAKGEESSEEPEVLTLPPADGEKAHGEL